MGYKPKEVASLVKLNLQYHHETKTLYVNKVVRDDTDALDKIHNAILMVFVVRKFLAGRFAGLGRVWRHFVASLYLGMDDVIFTALADEANAPYYMGGFRRLTPEVRHEDLKFHWTNHNI